MDKVIPLIALQRLRGIGAKKALKVAEDVPIEASEFISYVNTAFKRPLQEAEYAWHQALQIMEECDVSGIHAVAVTDENYPERLRKIHNENPPVVYIKGAIDILQSNATVIAIIGTREPTQKGLEGAFKFGSIAAQNNIPVVSGLAYGCDYYGHRGCLDQDGIAVAVLAHGLDMVYPREHRSLANQIIEKGGCLLSEYPPGTQTTRWSFVARDRLQSALSDIVIVIQTGVLGGTRHTAKFAKTQEKKILCLRPHHSDSNHPSVQGNSEIVQKQGADWINNPDDLLESVVSRHVERESPYTPEFNQLNLQQEIFG